MCSVDTDLANKFNEDDKRDIELDNFMIEIDSELVVLKDLYNELVKTSKSYSGYDFSTDLESAVKDLL